MDTRKLKQQVEENPIAAAGVASMLIASTAKFIDAMSAAKGRKAYAKQVNYSIKRQQRRK